MDKSIYNEHSFEESDRTVKYWKSRPWWERLQAAYRLSLRAYGYGPDDPEPRVDRSVFEIRYKNGTIKRITS